MSYVFDAGAETVWSPALRTGELYARFLRETAAVLGLPTGLVEIASDMYEIDLGPYETLIAAIFETTSAARQPVLRGLLESVLLPSIVILDRAGRPLTATSPEQVDLIARAQALAMPR
ncbi:hypothetical protein AOZ06_22860 [Kibdelosporangium phytohabitans]|uniref:Uncharacterized protein n=2 Tax=Kibdelosporangium phytohabitans TaxID=860235 RepID=A0A0N9HW04_9PSEU|nr:DUF6086 family protein [Kibdelosporangium phytohabitans]ALG09370.1 hypothetical protein AOZ06_22860 [Kibdelosporangium phytohabitans]